MLLVLVFWGQAESVGKKCVIESPKCLLGLGLACAYDVA